MEVWKCAHHAQSAIVGPAGRGWKITDSGLEVDWCQEDTLPRELVDILCDQPTPEDENDDFELVNICDAVQEEGFDTEETVVSSSV